MYLEYALDGMGAARQGHELPDTARPSAEIRLKRLIDVGGALVLSIVCLPIFLIAVLAVKIASPGPALFRQLRPGLHGRRIVILKLRTMHVGAELEEVPLRPPGIFFKMKSDPRVFPLGGWLRKYSVDELPQLFNVLRGEMSLVGPRPILESDLDRFEEWKQLRRFQVKPGLTGLWQVNGRSSTSEDKRMHYDLHYVANWSLALDLKILLKTIPAVLKGEGAV